MRIRITAIVSTIIIGTCTVVAQADTTMPVAPNAVTHNMPMTRPGTHLQRERAELKKMEKRYAYLKTHKEMKAAAIEGKRIRAEKAEIARLERHAAAAKTKAPMN